MNSETSSFLKESDIANELNEQIDLNKFLRFLLRNKKLITIITGTSIFLSGIYGFTEKRIWKGQFQIVITKSKSASDTLLQKQITQNPGLLSLGLGVSSKSDLQTQIEILKSPSVLLPIYNYVKNYKEKQGEEFSIKYKGWVNNNIEIGLSPGTRVLNLAYKDTDKNFIKPVLDKISETYQNYSGKGQRKSINEGISYLSNQIVSYKEKKKESATELTNFIYENDILELQKLKAEVAASGNLIKILELEIKKSSKKDVNPEYIIASSRNYPEFIKLISDLDKKDKELSIKKSIFLDNDELIIKLSIEKELLYQNLKKNYLSKLKSEKSLLENKKIITQKSIPLLEKFSELSREESQNLLVLNELETALRSLKLQKAKAIDPWELITKPTLQNSPVSPSKKKIVLFGLLLGLSLGIIISTFKEKRSDLIFEKDDIKKLLKYKILETFKTDKRDSWEESIYLLTKGNLFSDLDNLVLINSSLNKENINFLTKNIKKNLPRTKILITDNLIKAKKIDNQILVIEVGKTKRNELIDLRNKLVLQENPVMGLIIFDS